MKKEAMGHGVGVGMHGTNAKRAYAWLWHSWVEAQRELPSLRWISLAAVVSALGVLYLAVSEGKTLLDMVIYGAIAFMFVMTVPAIFYLLFEIYRKHRSDAIFDSKRLAEVIRKVAREEIEANEENKLAIENTLLMMQSPKTSKK